MTNIETLTQIAELNNMTLNEFVFHYLKNDRFREAVDKLFNDINSRRIPNGLEKLQVDFSILTAVSE